MNSVYEIGEEYVLRMSPVHGDYHISDHFLFGTRVRIRSRGTVHGEWYLDCEWYATEDMLEPVGGPW